MSASSNDMVSSVEATEAGDVSAFDSLQPEPLDMRVKMEAMDEREEKEEETQQRNIEPQSVAMADGTIINEPSELEILHALDQKINRLERMTVGIFEIIRHLGVQVHSVSNHLSNVDNKIERILQVNSVPSFGSVPVGQASMQPSTYDQTSDLPTMHQHLPAVPISEVASIPTDGSTRRLSWNERFEELKRYRENNGHCDVPQVYDTGLGTWVSAQRSQFKRYIVGKTSSMTHPRKLALDNLGFSWSLRKRFSWGERYAEIRHYSETHNGSCDVPNEEDYKPLWTWCQNQKQAYKRGREGKSHPVPNERVQLMEQIGFKWSTGSGDSTEMYLPLASPTEDSGSPMSDSDGLCSEIGEL